MQLLPLLAMALLLNLPALAAEKTQTLAECGQWTVELGLLTQARAGRIAVDVTFAPKNTRNPSARSQPTTETLFVGPITTEGEVTVTLRDGYTGQRQEVMCKSCIIAGSVKLRPDVPDTAGLIGDAAAKVTEPGQVIELTFHEAGKTQTIRGRLLDMGREADVKFREKLTLADVKPGEIPVDTTNTDPDPRIVAKIALLAGGTQLVDIYDIDAKSIKVVVDERLKLQTLQLQVINQLWSAIVASTEIVDPAKPTLGRVKFKNGETVVMDGPMNFAPDPVTNSGLFLFKNDKGVTSFVRVFPAPLGTDGKFTVTPQHASFQEGDDVVLTAGMLAELKDDWLIAPFAAHGMLMGKVGAMGELVWGVNMEQMGWFKNMVDAAKLLPQLTQSFAYFRAGTSRAMGSPGFEPPRPPR